MISSKTILKYRRETDCWACSWCDTENNMMLGKCTLCNSPRTSDSIILKHWTEADDIVVAPPAKVAPPARVAPPSRVAPPYASPRTAPPISPPVKSFDEPIFRDNGDDMPVEGNSNIGLIIFIAVIATIVVIALFIAAFNS